MTKKKVVLIAAAMVLVAALAIGGTVAYLFSTSHIKNTFTVGKVDMTFSEEVPGTSGTTVVGGENTYSYVPGDSIKKVATVTIGKSSEDSFLFVELSEDEGFGTFFDYALTTDWKALDAVNLPGVYYSKYTKNTTKDTTLHIFKNDTITAKEDPTTENPDSISLTVYCGAIQSEHVVTATNTEAQQALEAWTELTGSATGSLIN